MFDKRLIKKTYKFIYIDRTNCDYDDRGGPTDYGTIYTFGNVAPKGMNTSKVKRKAPKYSNRWRIRDFFSYEEFPSGEKATEANLTKAMMLHWKSEVERASRQDKETLSDLRNKKYNVAEAHQVKLFRSRNRKQLKGYRSQEKIWRKKYQNLEKTGVYTWLILNG